MADNYYNLDKYDQTSEILDQQVGSSVEDVDVEQLSSEPAAAVAKEHISPHAIKAYKKNCSQSISDEQIVEYLPLVNRIVNNVVSYLTGPLSKDDLVSAGTIGLVKAARDYDPSKNADFKTYAYIRIKGAVIDELRKWSFTPSDVSKQIDQVHELAIEMSEELGVTPSDEELAQRAGITVERLNKLYEGSRKKNFLSIHGVTDDAPSPGMSLMSPGQPMPDARLQHQEMVEILANAIQELPDNARRIIILYYDQQLTMKEIAEVLGVTESRVSQLHASAIFKLSIKMSQYDDARQD